MIDLTKISFNKKYTNDGHESLTYRLESDGSFIRYYMITVNNGTLNHKAIYFGKVIDLQKGDELIEINTMNFYLGKKIKNTYSLRGDGVPKKYRYIWLELKEMYKAMEPISDLII